MHSSFSQYATLKLSLDGGGQDYSLNQGRHEGDTRETMVGEQRYWWKIWVFVEFRRKIVSESSSVLYVDRLEATSQQQIISAIFSCEISLKLMLRVRYRLVSFRQTTCIHDPDWLQRGPVRRAWLALLDILHGWTTCHLTEPTKWLLRIWCKRRLITLAR